MRRTRSVWGAVVVMVLTSWAVAPSAGVAAEECDADRVQVNVLSPQEGETYEAGVPLRFVIEPGCHATFRVVIDGREYEPKPDAGVERPPYHYSLVRGGHAGGRREFSGCRTGSSVWRGRVELSPGEHHLAIDDCPKGTQVAAAFGEPRVVHFATGHYATQSPLPDTGVGPVLLVAAVLSLALGIALLQIAHRPAGGRAS